MRRWLFTFFSFLSLVLCLASCALWVRSHSSQNSIQWWRDPERKQGGGLFTYPGQISFFTETIDGAVASPQHDWVYESYSPNTIPLGFASGDRKWDIPAVVHFRASTIPEVYGWEISVNLWVLAVFFAILPTVWTRRFIRNRGRFREGCCTVCGYDLRATPNRCPECGAVSSG